ncbi:MAG TPA: CoA pyrophosphatase [Kofleriaceae bacterium]|nr:CoA pyrophosphatase [Kofleriaceae bacterium]
MASRIETLLARLQRNEVRPPDDGQRRAAVAAVVHDDRVLLMKRSARDGDPWSGHISLPGGGYQTADGDLHATAIREAREELAIDLAATRWVGTLPALAPLMSGPRGIEVTPFVFAAEAPPDPHTSAEAESSFWLPLALAESGALDGSYRYPHLDRVLPCWNYEHHVIWGLTFRILNELLIAAR